MCVCVCVCVQQLGMHALLQGNLNLYPTPVCINTAHLRGQPPPHQHLLAPMRAQVMHPHHAPPPSTCMPACAQMMHPHHLPSMYSLSGAGAYWRAVRKCVAKAFCASEIKEDFEVGGQWLYWCTAYVLGCTLGCTAAVTHCRVCSTP